MKIVIDTKGMLGNEIRFLYAKKWTDFNDKSDKGVIIDCVCIERDYEKVSIKISGDSNFLLKGLSEFEKSKKLEFEDLNGMFWNMNGKYGVSFKATGVKELV